MRKVAYLAFLTMTVAVLGRAAAVPAVTLSNTTGEGLVNGPYTLGWEFTTTSQITVSELGVFDDSQDGLLVSHQVGIWNSVGTLLGMTTVQAGTVDPLVNQFRYAAISGGPITLASGQTYEIGAVWDPNTDPMLFPGEVTGFGTDPRITFDQNSYIASSTLTDPTNTTGTTPAYFGPNFLIGSGVSVPEPSTLLLLGTGFVGLAGLLRRKLKF